MEFVVGDLVMLSTLDLCMYNNHKFSACLIGLFKVLKGIGMLAYRIELPLIYSALYNEVQSKLLLFHVSKLKLYIPGGYGTSTNVQPVLVNGDE